MRLRRALGTVPGAFELQKSIDREATRKKHTTRSARLPKEFRLDLCVESLAML